MGKHASQGMAFDVGYASDVGSRDNQEDSLGFRQYDDGSLLAVLADGMGGHAGGEVASEMAVRLFGEYFPQTLGSIPARLEETLHYTQRALCRQAQAKHELKTMGATLIALFVQGSDLYWVSVGDSLLYALDETGLVKLNAAHTVRERFRRLWESGKISRAELEAVEEPHALTSALGPDKLHEIDNNPGVFHPDGVLILASDGLLSLGQTEVKALAAGKSAAQVTADRLLQAALAKRQVGQDNIGLIVIKHLPSKPLPRPSLLTVFGGILILGASAGIVYQFYQAEQEKQAMAAQLQAQSAEVAKTQAERLAAEEQAKAAAAGREKAEAEKQQAEKKASLEAEGRKRAERASRKAQDKLRQAQEKNLVQPPPQTRPAARQPLVVPEIPKEQVLPPAAPPVH